MTVVDDTTTPRRPSGLSGRAAPPSSEGYRVDPGTGCWIWLKEKTSIRGRKTQYGRIYVNGKKRSAHRYFYEKENGPIPGGKEIDHLCRNTLCVNPAHLEAVTHAENMQRSSPVKLSIEKAREIRSLFASGQSMNALAEKYGVTAASIRQIVNNKQWVERA